MRYFLNKPINLNRHRTRFEDVPELHPLLLINLLRRLGLEVWDCVSSCSESGCHRSSGTSASNTIDIKTAVGYIVLICMLNFAFVHTFITILIDIIVLSDLVACLIGGWYRACVVIHVTGSSPGLPENVYQCHYIVL